MRQKRRKFTAEFKLKVILEVLKERCTLSELAQKYELHPNQISNWKTEFLNNASSFMNKAKSKTSEKENVDIEKLYSKVGRLQIENDFLKKKLY